MNNLCPCDFKPSVAALPLGNKYIPIVANDGDNGMLMASSEGLVRRVSESISWANTKLCMGFTFFANDEHIGVGIVKNDLLFSIVSVRVDDFFRISGEDFSSMETSIISAIQIEYDLMMVSAVGYYNDMVIYASYTISASSLTISCPTRVYSMIETLTTQNRYESMYDVDGNSNGIASSYGAGDMITTFESYDKSTGFSYVSSSRHVADRQGNVLIDIYDLIIDDIKSIHDSFDKLEYTSSIESFQCYDKIYIMSFSKSQVRISLFDGSTIFTYGSFSFTKPGCSGALLDNMYFGSIANIPVDDWLKEKNYYKIFSPPGVFYRAKTFKAIAFWKYRKEDGKIYIDTYYILPDEDEDGALDFSIIVDEDTGKLKPVESIDLELGPDCEGSSYSVYSRDIMMNSILDENVAARFKKTKITYDSIGLSGEIRCMSMYIPYLDKR